VDLPAHLMLSVALVHEIGHLLLDSDDHAPSGIMRAEWDQDDLNTIRRGQFHFTSGQIRRMKTNIEKRSDAKARLRPLLRQGNPSFQFLKPRIGSQDVHRGVDL
jgi:hypothetical protein